jgi:hypothetical protein
MNAEPVCIVFCGVWRPIARINTLLRTTLANALPSVKCASKFQLARTKDETKKKMITGAR